MNLARVHDNVHTWTCKTEVVGTICGIDQKMLYINNERIRLDCMLLFKAIVTCISNLISFIHKQN